MFKRLDIRTPQDLMKFFESNLEYGFVYRNKIFTPMKPYFSTNMDKLYKIRLGEDLIKNKYGVCWDFCELERKFFLQNTIAHECFFIDSQNKENGATHTHTFALFKQNGKWYWFEYSWFYQRGIWEYATKEEALKDILLKYKKFHNDKLINIAIYKTKKVTKRLDVCEFMEHCVKGEKIQIDI